jgi:heme/copper-type cytochrome/quinol oxidase subunit 2
MLDASLIAIIGVFCAIMFGVLGFCLRERRRARANRSGNTDVDHAQDTRVAIVLFGAIIVGAVLALITMYLVFFRQWE